MPLPISDTMDIVPTPAMTPVINLNGLLLSRLQNACVKPSIFVGAIKAKVHQIFK